MHYIYTVPNSAPNVYGTAAVGPSALIDAYGKAEVGETPMAYGSGGSNGSRQL